MTNLWLIAKREYLDRVRKRSFLIVTILVPISLGLFMFLPAKLASSHKADRHIAIVTSDQQFGESVRDALVAGQRRGDTGSEFGSDTKITYTVDVSTDTSEANKSQLREQVSNGKLDAFLWMPKSAVDARKLTYFGRELGDVVERSALRLRINRALIERGLAERGVPPAEMEALLKGVSIEGVRLDRGKESKTNASMAIGVTFALAMLLYMTLLFYGIAVMRAIIEEKSSRVMEVLLASVSPRDLMAGKILGVGAVGLTQVGIWLVMAALYAGPTFAAMMSVKQQPFHIDPVLIASFIAFFLLGYLVYSTLYAAVGASVNTEQESQQLQMIITLPLAMTVAFIMNAIRAPHSALAVFLSLFPLTSPVLMFARMSAAPVPAWQVVLSLLFLAITVYALLWLCARIYRVGILMYGKRPTLPEIIKWIRYAS